jgi:bacteriocin-like protein
MASKVDVTVSLNEVLAKLTKDGTLRKALLELADEKAKGQPVGSIQLAGQTELSEKDLQAVTGGAVMRSAGVGTSLDYAVLRNPTAPFDPGGLANADTRW